MALSGGIVLEEAVDLSVWQITDDEWINFKISRKSAQGELCGKTDGRKNTTKLKVALRNFVQNEKKKNSESNIKVDVKFALEQTMKTQRGEWR
jgi:hypothetical protein